MITGSCECGSVAFEVPTVRETVTVCHCSQCRKTSGHLWASTHAAFDSVTFTKDDGLVWYASSAEAKRGFCQKCGSSLFYRMNDEAGIGIAAGCLDNTAGLHVGKHIFIANKGDYYAIPDDETQLSTT
ncbi:MAG: GFA family protein [Pseudomonadota bacterium]